MQSIEVRSGAMSAVFKEEAHKLVDQLPDSASWSELMYQAALRASIERGVADIEAGRVIPVEELMIEFGAAE
jgi:hypothetical protein